MQEGQAPEAMKSPEMYIHRESKFGKWLDTIHGESISLREYKVLLLKEQVSSAEPALQTHEKANQIRRIASCVSVRSRGEKEPQRFSI
jgi:hypothetical protein